MSDERKTYKIKWSCSDCDKSGEIELPIPLFCQDFVAELYEDHCKKDPFRHCVGNWLKIEEII